MQREHVAVSPARPGQVSPGSSRGRGVGRSRGRADTRVRPYGRALPTLRAGLALIAGWLPARAPAPALAAPAGQDPAIRHPSGLRGHVGLGLAVSGTDVGAWMPASGVPWDYVNLTLSGGVNTGQGWQGRVPDGGLPRAFAGSAGQQKYIPVFTYSMLAESAGTCGQCGTAHRALVNLNDKAVMAAYFEDFAQLLRRLAEQGGPAIVHVEPDVAGWAQQAVLDGNRCFGMCAGQGNDPALLSAAVSRAGHPLVEGLPDTYQGFSWALLRLRDRLAPKVLLAFHVSPWAPLHDVSTSTDPNLDDRGLGTAAGVFAAHSGVVHAPGSSTYDLLFTDVADRDAGFYKALHGVNVWWDRHNLGYPNFHRWQRFIDALVRVTTRPVVVWRIPLGNQRMRTMDNSAGHYQDNRAEYFLDHMGELASSGVIGLVFGNESPAAKDVTHTQDARGDGVTNPGPVCTEDGVSSGSVCTSEAAAESDDDGGFLRAAAKRYYGSGGQMVYGAPQAGTPALNVPPMRVVLTGASLGTNGVPAGRAEQRVPVTLQLGATRDAGVLVDYELYSNTGERVWQMARKGVRVGHGQVAVTETLSLPPLQPGWYTLKVGVFTENWGTMFVWGDVGVFGAG